MPFCLGCGTCPPCRAGETQLCDDDYQPGFTGWGSFAQYVALPHAALNLVRLPEDLGFVAAAALGCRFMTAYAAVAVHGRPGAGDWVAVHGCGGVGLSAVMIGVALGARVAAVDVEPAKLALARELGAEVALDARDGDGDVAAAVREATGGGAHVSHRRARQRRDLHGLGPLAAQARPARAGRPAARRRAQRRRSRWTGSSRTSCPSPACTA